MRSETVTQSAPAAAGALRAAVDRVSRELAAHPARLSDRGAAEEELGRLRVLAAGEPPDVARLRGSLLLVAAALGSVSALAAALEELRRAVDAFGSGTRPPRSGAG
ncbi:DUF5955 family protein [Streptomyces sp. RKND-216]|uniref:DUF5955 family protein n=1 Tax=Streptomyces sp. RKND-216 TaxID=2562581 RepID=UPI001FF7A306|nr:DUF5955 family protein [Streptomyces sp. RKND-216]